MLNNYLTLIHTGANSHVYYQSESDYQCPIVIKILNSENSNLARLQPLYNEFELTHALQIPGIRKALARVNMGSQPALILEYVKGEPPGVRTHLLKSHLIGV